MKDYEIIIRLGSVVDYYTIENVRSVELKSPHELLLNGSVRLLFLKATIISLKQKKGSEG